MTKRVSGNGGSGELRVVSRREEQDLQDAEYGFPYHYVARFGAQFQHHFVDTWAINYAATMEYLLGRLRGSPPSRIIDIGCGDGRFSRELALAFPSSSILGIDYSKRATDLAAAMNPDVGNLAFRCLDINADTGLEPFDAAILMEVFEHIPLPEAQRFMASVRRLIAPGGQLFMTVPHRNKPLEYKHFQHFSAESVSAYLRDEFDVLEIVPFERRGLLRKVIEKLLCNRLWVLNHGPMLNAFYRLHRGRLFDCATEGECQRLFILARAK